MQLFTEQQELLDKTVQRNIILHKSIEVQFH